MPKLNTTIDNLELKTNRVIGTVPSSDWTDNQYPSAKTLYTTYDALHNDFNGVSARCSSLESTCGTLTTTCNGLTSTCNNLSTSYNSLAASIINIAHPVGSIMITSTNANPASTIGGSWVLVDKGFADRSGYLTSTHWTTTNARLTDSNSALYMLKDHMISIRLGLTTTATLSDSTIELGKLNLSTLGVSELPYTIVSDVAASDGGNCTVSYTIVGNGTITTTDVLALDSSHSLASGNTLSIHINQAVSHTEMLDAYCDKFYWKRTA